MTSEPARTLDEAALAAHELYLSYVRAGFTPEEALQIVIALLSQNLAHHIHGGGE